jgi:phosphatidylglycerophosphatase A
MTTSSNAPPAIASPKRKPRISLAIATAFGLGYIPKAPGTFGSLAGVALALTWLGRARTLDLYFHNTYFVVAALNFQFAVLAGVSLIGVWTASRAAAYLGAKDPQIIVIDEVSGQYLALVIGSLWPLHFFAQRTLSSGLSSGQSDFSLAPHPLNWKCVLAGFILFRVFDIWKPFPARQAESLPRGWGIMADDWVAGIYAGLGVLLLRAAGL